MDMTVPSPTQPNGHGFYVLTDAASLLSHIPMFMAPHEEQIFLQVQLTAGDGTDPAAAIRADRARSGATEYVLATDLIILTNLKPDSPTPLRLFTGNVYRGWPFDDPPTAPLIVPNVTISVSRSILYTSLVGAKPLSELSYYAFRTPDGLYLAHVVTQPPDFDQILRAEAAGLEASDSLVELQFPEVPNTISKKLVPGRTVNAVIAGKGSALTVTVGDVLIDNSNHLAARMTPAS